MLKNYLLLAFRQLRKNRGYSAINIVGLATGMAIALVIGLWSADELNFDKSYPEHSRITQIMQDQQQISQTAKEFLRKMRGAGAKDADLAYTGETISSALQPFIKKGYDDVFTQTGILTYPYDRLLVNGDKSISRPCSSAEYTFPLIFGYRFLSGSAESLRDPSTAVISRSTAIALYGTDNAVGKTFKADNHVPYTVGGVYADLPENTSFHDIACFTSLANQEVSWLMTNTDFSNHSCRMYAKLAGNTTVPQATARIKNICTPYVKNSIETYRVIPFEDVHLHYNESLGAMMGGRIGFVRLLATIGVFILLLACINFMNLATARSEKRAKEVGIRKTVGSLRGQLIAQFLGESVLVTFFAFIGSLALAIFSMPWFSDLAGKPISIPWTSPLFWAVSLAFTLITGLLAGSYPAFYLSSFRPVKVLKGAFKAGRSASLPRKILVVAQFGISLSLIIGTIIVFRQIQFAKDRPIGYDNRGLITVPINTDSLDHHFEAVRTALLNTGAVANVTTSSQTLTNWGQNNWLEWSGMTEETRNITFRDIWINADYGATVGWNLVRGRDLSRQFLTDSNACIVNEEGARILGFKNPIGQTVKHWGKPYHIVGVIKNMVVNDAYSPIQPAIFLGDGGHSTYIIRIKPGTPVRSALAAMEPVFKKFNPASPFIYHFNDEDFEKKFQLETRIGSLATVFSCLAILISCLGLFGLASFMAEQRTKEIGVRKVLGARVVNLWALLSGDFLKLIILSMAIAMPLIAWIMSNWLQNYALHTVLNPWIFAASGAGMLFVTICTVSYQALRAAIANPIKSLRTE